MQDAKSPKQSADTPQQATVSTEQSRELIQESIPNHELTNKSAPACTKKSASLTNGPRRSRRSSHWGRTPVSITSSTCI